MPLIEEYDHLIDTSASGYAQYADNAALNDRIREWLETPEGTVADLPGWGNRLFMFKHDPPGAHLEVALEMHLAYKMPIDIENLVILEIGVEFREIDYVVVTIRHQLGGYEEGVRIGQ